MSQREGILASGKHRFSPARSPPMCCGLDLLPDWDTPYIGDEFNCWCGVCTQHQTHLSRSSVSSQAERWPVEFSTVVSCAQSTGGPGLWFVFYSVRVRVFGRLRACCRVSAPVSVSVSVLVSVSTSWSLSVVPESVDVSVSVSVAVTASVPASVFVCVVACASVSSTVLAHVLPSLFLSSCLLLSLWPVFLPFETMFPHGVQGRCNVEKTVSQHAQQVKRGRSLRRGAQREEPHVEHLRHGRKKLLRNLPYGCEKPQRRIWCASCDSQRLLSKDVVPHPPLNE